MIQLGRVLRRDQVSAPDGGQDAAASSNRLEKAGPEDFPRPPADPQPALVSAALCLHCGKPLSLLSRLAGGGRFCSRVHKRKYTEEADELAMQALAWTQGAELEPVSRYRIFRTPASPLAGFVRLEPKRTVRIAGAFTPARRSFRPFDAYATKLGVKSSSYVAAAPGAVLAGAAFLFSPISAATAETPLRLSPPQAFRPRRVLLPKRFAPKVEFCFVPTRAGALPPAIELIQPEKSIPRARHAAPRLDSKVDRIRVVGVSDTEGPMLALPRESVPAVLGDPIAYKPPTLAESTLRSAPRLRRNSVEQGIYIPGLGMGTLRPRVAFGPGPDKLPSSSGRRNVVELRIPRSQRSREQDSNEADARARGGRGASGM